MSVSLRIAAPGDAPTLQAIYAPYVAGTAVSMEYVPPTVEEFRGRIEHTLAAYPYLVAVEDGEILGYCYASRLHPRAAYGWAAELSVYVKPSAHRKGVGRLLYESMEKALALQGVTYLSVAIAVTDRQEDAHLADDSPRFHARMGYTVSGCFRRSGFKFGKWYDLLHMEKQLETGDTPPRPFRPFPEVREDAEKLLSIPSSHP